MKAKRRADGTVDITGMPADIFATLLHAAGDLGGGQCILHYDPKVYSKYARPLKDERKGLLRFARLDGGYLEFFDSFEELEKPKFKRIKP